MSSAYPALVNNGVHDVPVWVVKSKDPETKEVSTVFIRRASRPGMVPTGTLDSFKVGDMTCLVYPVVRIPKGQKPLILSERSAFNDDDGEMPQEFALRRAPDAWYRAVSQTA